MATTHFTEVTILLGMVGITQVTASCNGIKLSNLIGLTIREGNKQCLRESDSTNWYLWKEADILR